MNTGVQIIQAGIEHLDIIAPLFDGYRQFYEQDPDLIGARAFLQERITRGESVIFLALDEQGRGCGFTQLYPVFTSIGMRRAWLLNDLFVASEARRMGVAEALMLKAREFGISTDAKYLSLETAITNADAQRVYKRLGWVRDEEHYFYSLSLPRKDS
jgi:ribosomal protein S18 acetylase RimI-like enzyme